METPTLKSLALQVLERNRQGNQRETVGKLHPARTGPKVSTPPEPLRQLSDVPGEWLEGVATLRDMPPQRDYTARRWSVLQTDAQILLETWAARAHQLGWTGLDLFGCHDLRPAARWDCAGLACVLNGHKVVAITADEAVTETARRKRLKIPRRPQIGSNGECTLLWRLKKESPQ